MSASTKRMFDQTHEQFKSERVAQIANATERFIEEIRSLVLGFPTHVAVIISDQDEGVGAYDILCRPCMAQSLAQLAIDWQDYPHERKAQKGTSH